jgi:glycosyltransferase involved in cell wall biosynthesis
MSGPPEFVNALNALACGTANAHHRAVAFTAAFPCCEEKCAHSASIVDDLVALPAAHSPIAWHLTQLKAALSGLMEDAVRDARVRYHARWAWHALVPDDPRSKPVVSVIIPVFNRASLVIEAIECCLSQTYPAIQIVVADDGSTDSIELSLSPYRNRIVFVRQRENRGVAAARNLALRHATGDLVHFLDSDNLLAPDAVEAKVAAFFAVPDADLCYSSNVREYASESVRRQDPERLPIRDPHSPVWNCDRMIVDLYFIISSVLMPRHLVMEMVGFDERLRRGEDFRFFSRLGLRGIKVIAIDRQLVRRRIFDDSLSHVQTNTMDYEIFSRLLTIADGLDQPQHWRITWTWLLYLMTWPGWPAISSDGHKHAQSFRNDLLDRIKDVPKNAGRHGLSARPLLRVLRGIIVAQLAGRSNVAALEFEARLLAAIDCADAASADPQAADLSHWLRTFPLTEEIPVLLCLSESYDRALSRGHPWFPLDGMLWRTYSARFMRPWRRWWLMLWYVTHRHGPDVAMILARAPNWFRAIVTVTLRTALIRELHARPKQRRALTPGTPG